MSRGGSVRKGTRRHPDDKRSKKEGQTLTVWERAKPAEQRGAYGDMYKGRQGPRTRLHCRPSYYRNHTFSFKKVGRKKKSKPGGIASRCLPSHREEPAWTSHCSNLEPELPTHPGTNSTFRRYSKCWAFLTASQSYMSRTYPHCTY